MVFCIWRRCVSNIDTEHRPIRSELGETIATIGLEAPYRSLLRGSYEETNTLFLEFCSTQFGPGRLLWPQEQQAKNKHRCNPGISPRQSEFLRGPA